MNIFSDPLEIRKSTAFVARHFKFVSVNKTKIKSFANEIRKRINDKNLLDEWQFGKFRKTPQHIFIMDTVNFLLLGKKG